MRICAGVVSGGGAEGLGGGALNERALGDGDVGVNVIEEACGVVGRP